MRHNKSPSLKNNWLSYQIALLNDLSYFFVTLEGRLIGTEKIGLEILEIQKWGVKFINNPSKDDKIQFCFYSLNNGRLEESKPLSSVLEITSSDITDIQKNELASLLEELNLQYQLAKEHLKNESENHDCISLLKKFITPTYPFKVIDLKKLKMEYF